MRFGEWSQACFDIQRDYLLGEDGAKKWDLRCMSVYHETDGQLLDEAKELITGRCMDQWWDKSDGAGPAARAAEPFNIEPPSLECLAISEGELRTLFWDCETYIVRMESFLPFSF